MKSIAVLLTCHNRKAKTLKCLEHLYIALNSYKNSNELTIKVYLTDDGSSDGTSLAVLDKYPKTTIIQGSGNLFWANGMISSWQNAQKGQYDGYLLLNDDTIVYPYVFEELFRAHKHCVTNYKKTGIYIGATENDSKELTYSGAIVTNYLLASIKVVVPDGSTYQKCDFGNANIMLVHKDVIKKIGILSQGYSHGKADYDYTMKAKKANIPSIICPNICGNCDYDHDHSYVGWETKNVFERKKSLYSPTGVDFRSQLRFNRKFFPLRWPIVFALGYFKILFPKLYLRRFNLQHKS